MKRIIAMVLCLITVLGLFAGCDGGNAYVPTGGGLYQDTTAVSTKPPSAVEQVLTLGYNPDSSLNPYTATDRNNRVLFSLIYQGLFAVDKTYTPWPILCAEYTVSRDLLTYTFYLAEATFADGSALSARDVTASLLAAKESPVYQGRFTQVSQIRATEDGAVEITLHTPYENLPLLLDIPIVPASQVDAPRPAGTGPYRWEESLSGPRLLRRKDWWCRANLAATASYISLLEVDSTTTIRDDFEFGNIGIVCADPGSDSYVDFRCDYELWDCENGIFLYLACNEKSKVFKNASLRAALTHAIDRDTLVTAHYRGFAMSATLPASPDSPHYNKQLAGQYGYDPEVFQAAVERANLGATSVTLLVNKADTRRVRVARAVADMLTQGGLTVKLSILEGEEYTNALTKKNYDLHLGQTKLSANMDLSAFFDSQGALNYGDLADATTLALCREALANAGNFDALHRQVMDDGMLCPILFRSYAIYTQRGLVDDLSPARDNLFFYHLGKTLEQARISA